ncbi:MAG: hypothetical protein GY714_32445 [Desulfobacterales bacterium]|nr:hypothetical protein [Desulfobacterales bacterium]
MRFFEERPRSLFELSGTNVSEKSISRRKNLVLTQCYPLKRYTPGKGQLLYYNNMLRDSKLHLSFNLNPQRSRKDEEKISEYESKTCDDGIEDKIALTGIEEAFRKWTKEKDAIAQDVFWDNLGWFDRFTPLKWRTIKVSKKHVNEGLCTF